MLASVLIVLTCVSAVVSVYGPYQGQNNGYKQPYGNGNRNNIQQDIRQLEESLNNGIKDNELIVERLTTLAIADGDNTRFRDDFVNTDYSGVRIRQQNQSEQIGGLFRKANEVLLQVANVEVLISTVEELQTQASELEKESLFLQNEANRLKNTDAQQEKKLAALRDRLTAQERNLTQLENATRETQELLRRNDILFENITTIQDTEQAEVVEVLLTKENPTFTQILDRDFKGTSPTVFYGFSNIRVEDQTQSYILPTNYATKSYNGYAASFRNATIKFTIDVQLDPKTTTLFLTLLDGSTQGWSVTTLSATVFVINISNAKLSPVTSF